MNYRDTATWLKNRLSTSPQFAIVLGTGLGDLGEHFKVLQEINYSEIPGFVVSTAPSHKGKMLLCEIGGKAVLLLQGRFHYYEGYSMEQVVFPTRVLSCLGLKCLIITNAAGSLRKELVPGTIVMLTDHINFMGINPLIGENDNDLGERFPSMNQPYDPSYRDACRQIAKDLEIGLAEGVYIGVTGPSLETRAECAFFATVGADLVGMSTVPEVIAARHAGLKVLGFSIVSNYSNLFHDLEHSQEEIRQNANLAGRNLRTILERFITET